jgi:hypothetical protein
VPELRQRCHELLQRLDALESQHSAPIARAQLVLTRAHVERTLMLLPNLVVEPHPPPKVAESAPPPPPTAAAPPPPSAAPPRPSANPQGARAQVLPKPLDPKLLAAVEPLLHQGNWRELRKLLATESADPRGLPPALSLLYAIALKEDTHPIGAESEAKPAQSDALGIRAMSQLLAVPEQSVMAMVIGKRALRRRPLDWNQKPPTRVSLLLVTAALLAGAFIGLLFHPSLLGLFWK